MNQTHPTVILGIDPGYAIVGWGLIRTSASAITYLDCGAVVTNKETLFSQRLQLVYQEMLALLEKTQPNVIAIEQLFFSVNTKTALAVAHARGIILLAATQRSIPVIEYGPLQVKQSITGDGTADKRQVQAMVKRILHLSTIPKPDDVADAVAIALTHAYHSRVETLVRNL